MVGACAISKAETNAVPSASPLFSVPTLQLRPFPSDPESAPQPQSFGERATEARGRLLSALQAARQADATPETNFGSDPNDPLRRLPSGLAEPSSIRLSQSSEAPATEDFELGIDQSRFAQIYRRLDEGGYLTRPELKPDGLLARLADSFEPEVIHLGKTTTLSCTLITAIKHKNPFCLLNPVFLVLSW